MNRLQATLKLSALIACPFYWEDEDVLLDRVRTHDYYTPDYDRVRCEPGVVRQRLIDAAPVGILDGTLYVDNDIWWSNFDNCWMTTEPGDYTPGYIPCDARKCPIDLELAFFRFDRKRLGDN